MTTLPTVRLLRSRFCFLFLLVWSNTIETSSFADEPREKKVRGYAKYVVRHYGDADRGKTLMEKDNIACSKCHAIDGQEKNAPNLRGIANKFSREDLVRHILMPSLTIRPGYETTEFLLHDGRVVSGNVREANEDHYIIWNSGGEPTRVPTEDIESQQVSTISLMPDNLLDQVSREQLSDLVAYLETLRTERRQGLIARDTEVEIPLLENPVNLIPIHTEKQKFNRPVWFESIPGHENEYVVLEHQSGRIWRLSVQDEQTEKTIFLDLSNEVSRGPNEGLMCIAFHPNYEKNGRYFLKHENRDSGKLQTRVIERQSDSTRLLDSGKVSRQLFAVKQPAGNHNGGCIRFGPDGFLYIAFGDGGPQKDPHGRSQSTRELLGSMMRIDVDQRSDARGYGIPEDNPFLTESKTDPMVRPEIWAVGFREPWRFSFDSLTGDLWLGDVGQVDYEEVSIVQRGQNYGWNVMEGYEPFSEEYHTSGTVYTPPVFAYSHSLGASITGGHVFRGDPQSSFFGVYIFGDFESRRIWGIQWSDGKFKKIRELGRSPIAMSSFGLDDDGDVCMVGFDGLIYKLDLSVSKFE